MEVMKQSISNHFITEKSYSPALNPSTFSQPKTFHRDLPKIITCLPVLQSLEKQSFSTRNMPKFSTITFLRENPSFAHTSLNFNSVNTKPNEVKKRSFSKTKSSVEEYYDKVFNYHKNIFKAKKITVDNKLNIYGDDNEEQYQKHILKINQKRQKEGKLIREDNKVMKEINEQVKGIKKKICFMKGVVDYAYPKAVIQKNKVALKARVMNTDSGIGKEEDGNERRRKKSSSPEIKIRKSKTNGGCCFTMSSKDDELQFEREKLGEFLLQSINVKKCVLEDCY